MRTKWVAALVLAGATVFALRVVAAQAPAPAQRVLQLTFNDDGTVTLLAANVTARDILAEWARLGGCRVSNADQLRGGPLTLQFEHRPQIEVLESVLRSAAGLILGPRAAGSIGPSEFESVYILAASSPTASSPYMNAPPQPQMPTPGSPADEIPPVVPGPVQPAAPAAPPADQPARPSPTYSPGSGVFVPIVPVPPTTSGRGGTPPPASAGSGSLD